MSALWAWILLAAGAAYATKLMGYLVPRRLLERPLMLDLTAAMTVGLLTALVMVSTFASGQELRLDARALALAAAVGALLLRVPFLGVVVAGAVAAALARLTGVG